MFQVKYYISWWALTIFKNYEKKMKLNKFFCYVKNLWVYILSLCVAGTTVYLGENVREKYGLKEKKWWHGDLQKLLLFWDSH